MKRGARGKPTSIDEYLAGVEPVKRAALQKLRRSIRAMFPGAEECISYGMPAFRLDGRILAYFSAGAHHCALYPGGSVAAFEGDLAGYETSKGTIRFQPDKPLPDRLVRKILNARAAENASSASGTRRASRR
jgi:uncharacterized protein YdhG (YjbR/CyaY superfamily)